MTERVFVIDSEVAMHMFGAKIAQCCRAGMVCFLQGDLGAGKTTLVRGILRELSYKGIVKSPTYTLVESYRLADFTVHHFDLYRLADAEELEYIGVREYFSDQTVCFIEWAEKGVGFLPLVDVVFHINVLDDTLREVRVSLKTEFGACMQALQ